LEKITNVWYSLHSKSNTGWLQTLYDDN
jgi:hypothetical protein